MSMGPSAESTLHTAMTALRTQCKLVSDMERDWEKMREVVSRV